MRWGASDGKPLLAEKPLAKVLDKLLQLTIPSEYGASRKAQKKILGEIAKCHFSSHSLFAIKLALEESLVNAIKHGNHCDPGKHVHIEAHLSPEYIRISIEDEGKGFHRRAVPDPTAEENLRKCSGRGILLMEAYMDSVRWDRGGRRVIMTKNNQHDVLPG